MHRSASRHARMACCLQARDKRHSTVEEAVQVAEAAAAGFTVLTHFSQRYPHLPRGLPRVGDTAGGIAAAFDGMCVSLPGLVELPGLSPAIEAMFEEPMQH